MSSFTVKYKLPSALFSSHVKLNNIWSALEGFPGEGLEVPEACGLHPSPEVSKQRPVRHKRPYFILDGMIKLTKNCWQPSRQGLRRRQRGRAVRASDSRSSGPGFEFALTTACISVFHVGLEFESSATFVNNQLVCLQPVGILYDVMFTLNYLFTRPH